MNHCNNTCKDTFLELYKQQLERKNRYYTKRADMINKFKYIPNVNIVNVIDGTMFDATSELRMYSFKLFGIETVTNNKQTKQILEESIDKKTVEIEVVGLSENNKHYLVMIRKIENEPYNDFNYNLHKNYPDLYCLSNQEFKKNPIRVLQLPQVGKRPNNKKMLCQHYSI